jgi:20S proteasome alpha/beta subunit
MTLIFGARCLDGVVLVSDRLVKTGEKTDYNGVKIRACGQHKWAIFSAAGLGTLYEEFLNILTQNVNKRFQWIKYQNDKLKLDREKTFKNNPEAPEPPYFDYTLEDFKHDCVDLLTEMKNRYNVAFESDDDCVLQILYAVLVGGEAKLFYLDSNTCLSAEVPECLFIGYGPYVEIFRKLWHSTLNMKQSAVLATCAIKYIEKDEITKNVGVGTNKPQIWFIPDGDKTREVLSEELKCIMDDADTKYQEMYKQLHSLFRF